MIALLLKEANDAYHIPDDQRGLYAGLYERRGMSLLDFVFLMATAEKVVLKEGDRVITMGKENHHVYVVINGSLCVMKKGRFVCKLNELMFAGEMSFLRWKSHPKDSDGELSSADVTCLEDCVMYRWSFRDLDQLMRQNATVGMIFEGCISSEMNRKFHAEERSRTLRLYEQILHGAMMDGELNDKDKDNLTEFRQKNGISDQEHVHLIRDLGWTLAEFEIGQKGGPELPILEEYYEMLDGELCSGSLTPQGRSKLRQYRMYYLITSDKHLDFLAQLGWTMDEYEAGRKFTLAEQVSLASRVGSERGGSGGGRVATRALPALPPPALAGGIAAAVTGGAGGGPDPVGSSSDDMAGRPSPDPAADSLRPQLRPPPTSP
jgi:CRP-like cAMP-binding protein